MSQKRYVAQKSMHLGNIKTGVKVGTIIIHDEDTQKLLIEGQMFDNTKDLEIMLKYGWATPYNDKKAREDAEALKQATEAREAQRVATDMIENKKNKVLPVIKSDSDELKDIDISYTVKKHNKVEARDKNAKMEVIRGDEDADAHLNKQLEVEVPVVPIVKDDGTLGGVGGPSLNSGIVKTRSAEEHEKIRLANLEKAKKGFIDPRIAAAQKAVESVASVAKPVTQIKPIETPVVPVKRGRGRPPKAAKGTVESVVAETSPALPSLKSV